MRRAFAAVVIGAVSMSTASAFAQDKQACISASESGQKLRDEHKLSKAREQFILCAKDSCPGAIRQDCADAVQDIAKRMPSVVIHVKDKSGADTVDVAVSIDGEMVRPKLDGAPIVIDPGMHTFKLEAGGETVEKPILVSEGQQSRVLDFSFAKEPPPGVAPAVGEAPKRGFPILPTIVAGVGVLAFGSFAIFGLMGTGDFNSAKKNCAQTPTGCSSSTIDDIRTKLIVADVSLGVGIAAAVGATILYIVHFSSGGSPAKATVGIAPTPGGAAGSFSLKF